VNFPGRDMVFTSTRMRSAFESSTMLKSRTIDLTLLAVPTAGLCKAAGWACELVCPILLIFPLRDQKEFFLPERQDNTTLSIATITSRAHR
jgi:hypothetical protein